MSNHREEDPRIIANDRPARRGPEPPGEIVSFPASVRDRLAQAQALLRQDRPTEALAMLQHAGAELARASPELFVLLVARHMGMTKITVEEDEKNVRTVRYAMGVRYGREETTTTDSRTKRRTISLG